MTKSNDRFPHWFDGREIDEPAFCKDFRERWKLVSDGGVFFTPDGRVTDEMSLRSDIFEEISPFISRNVVRTVNSIAEGLRLCTQTNDFSPDIEHIHFGNGTLSLDGTFVETKDEPVRSRFPVNYNPQAKPPERWLSFLNDLFYPEDIPVFQEFVGYCLLPTNRGQRMMLIKGSGGEGKSQIGAVLSHLFGANARDGSVAKISENPFARADLEHVHLMIDDDMKIEALRQTNYVKSLVTAQGKVDLEKKGKQSYQGWMYARLLAFSNGDLQALYDRSSGFYRRQLILVTKERPRGRTDDPFLAEKMKAEAEGILLWALAGLCRLLSHDFRFSESERIYENREEVKRDANNVLAFMESEGYIRKKPDASVSSKELYATYRLWCDENAECAMKARTFTTFVVQNAEKYGLTYSNMILNAAGRRVRGFYGLERTANVPLIYYKD